MTIYLILIAALIIIGYLLYTPIKLRFRMAPEEKYVRMSYSLLGASFDIKTMLLRINIDGFSIYTRDMRISERKKKEKKAKREKKPEIKKRKKKGWLSLSGFRMEYLKVARALVGSIRIEELMVKIRGGILDPFNTGRWYGYYWALKGAFPSLMSHISFKPEFSSESARIEGKGVVYLRLYYILRAGIGVLAVVIKEKIGNLFVVRKRGHSYG